MRPARLLLAMAATAAGLGAALYLARTGGVLRDLRADILAWSCLMALAAAAGRSLATADLVPARGRGIAALAALSILVSSGPLAAGAVDFGRQVRAQWSESSAQKQADFLAWQTGLDGADLERARRQIPADASVLLLRSPAADDPYTESLVSYYLAPRRVYFWHGTPFQVLDGRVVALPPAAWLRAKRIGWLALLERWPTHYTLTARRLGP